MKKTKILTVANRKGGAGKSTCAAHIAMEAVRRGLKTILIDLDPQKTLEKWWNVRTEENPHLAEVNPENIEEEIAKLNNHNFDLCIIDTPGDISQNSVKGIAVADLVLIPSKPTGPDLAAIGRTIKMVTEENKKYAFIVTQATARTKLVYQGIAALSEFGKVAPCVLHNRTAYASAMHNGDTAVNEDKLAAEEMNQLWDFISYDLFGNIENENTNAKEKVRLDI